jgi:protein involved in polysaccharide export with SLBB domain
MKNVNLIRNIQILLFFVVAANAQSLEEINQLRKAYEDKQKAQTASEIINQGVESESNLESDPVKLIVEPSEIYKYYQQKMKLIEKDLNQLNRLLSSSDTLPPLENFGYNYFSLRDSIQFIDNANVSPNYVLGYGDEIIISVWGQAEQHEQAKLDRDGTVFIANVGLLYLGGKTIEQARSYVESRFSKIYSTISSNPPLTFLEFSIGKVKNINITVSGHVQFPGNYVVNPSMNLFNILVLAGGIIETGTLRNIKVQREGSMIDSLDLYPLIAGTGITKLIPLLDNDIIIVPPRGQIVAITGSVLNPAYFELNNNNNVKSMIGYSGGISHNGSDQVLIARLIEPNIYIPKSNFDKTLLMNGDSLIILNKKIKYKFISLSINNNSITRIPWIKDLSFNKILDIINLNKESIKDVKLVRLKIDEGIFKESKFNHKDENFNFQPSDHLSIHVIDHLKEPNFVIVKGKVNSPGIYPLVNHKETLNSILLRSGGLKLSSDLKSVIVKRDSLIIGSKTGELILANKDTIIAKTYLRSVTIKGAVHNPGNFSWSKKNTAKDYIRIAGGLNSNADKKHIILIAPYGEASRISTRSNASVLPGSIIKVSEKPVSNEVNQTNRFQQVSSMITSLVSIAILVSSTKQ